MKSIVTMFVATLLVCFDASAVAQDYPSKPIRLIVPYPAGGPTDASARALGSEVAAILGQPLVIDNRPGASGVLGLNILSASSPDGYTISTFTNSTVIAMHAMARPFDPEKQFTAIGNATIGAMLIVVNPTVISVKTLPELVTYLKQHPGTAYSSSGPGGPGNLAMEGLAKAEGLKITHIPYKGASPALIDVLGGRVGLIAVDGISARPHLASGALRGIASLSSVRFNLAPEVPTAAEQGFGSVIMPVDTTFGLIAPPGTPPAILSKLRDATRRAVAAEVFRRSMREAGKQAVFVEGPAWSEQLKNEYERWGQLISDLKIKVE